MSLSSHDRLGPSGLPLQPALCSTRFAFGPTKSRNIDSEAGSTGLRVNRPRYYLLPIRSNK